MMTLTATEFKAKCLAILDRVQKQRESITITKRGKVVARLVPADTTVERPWLRLRGRRTVWHGDPFAPVVRDRDIKALK
jgi:prevent-host-death family protein